MSNYNHTVLTGNLTRDPQLKYLPSQTPVVEFGFASSRVYNGPDGQRREDTLFVDCVAYGGLATVIHEHARKGRPLLVAGFLKYEQWEKDGQKRNKIRLVVREFSFLNTGDGGRDRTDAEDPQRHPQDDGPHVRQARENGRAGDVPVRAGQSINANRPLKPQLPPPPFAEGMQFKDDEIPF